MLVLDNLKASTIDKIVREHVDKDTVVVTDNSSSHVNFSEYFSKHEAYTEKGNVDDVARSALPWVHIVIDRCIEMALLPFTEMSMRNSCSYT